ncbi:hypothetical protein ACFLZW_01740 [Chloroflexota bacterium]
MDDFITLACPSCGGNSAIAYQSDRFICDYCGNEHIFHLPARNQPQPVAQQTTGSPKRRALLPRPEGITIRKQGDRLRITWRWFSAKYLGLLLFVIIWNAFLCFWYGIAFTSDGPWIMFVFPLLHVAVGVSLAYSTLAGFLNRTTILIDSQAFKVQHDPVPWIGEVDVPISELEQLYCIEKRQSSKNDHSFTYQLVALLQGGRKKKLVSNLDSPDIAIFLEQQIEKMLKISDQPVIGEFYRS